MCYGSPASAPLEMPEDMGKMVEISNGVCERLDRRMDFLHIPVPRNRAAAVYFQPLRELNVPEGTELILGLIQLVRHGPHAGSAVMLDHETTDLW